MNEDETFIMRALSFSEATVAYIRALRASGNASADVAECAQIITRAARALLADRATVTSETLDPDIWGVLDDLL